MDKHALPVDALEQFLGDGDPITITDLRLDEFLGRTTDLGLSPAERLRWLAINLEYEEFVDGSQGLMRIYERALEADPDSTDCYHSLVISAVSRLDEFFTPNRDDRLALAEFAENSIKNVIAKTPNSAELNYTYGSLLYEHPLQNEGQSNELTERALKQFEAALTKSPNMPMAMLYKAHCLHDQEKWEEAYNCYDQVDVTELVKEATFWNWRVFKLKEQKAFCAAKQEKYDKAREILESLFTELESLSYEEAQEDVIDLEDSVTLVTRIFRDQALLERLKEIVHKSDLERLYEDRLKIDSKGGFKMNERDGDSEKPRSTEP